MRLTNNGIVFPAPGAVTYARPADDPGFRLADDDPLVVCFEGDRNAIETRPGFGDGRMPRLASVGTRALWIDGYAPDVDTAPASFEPWLMSSGFYRSPVEGSAEVYQGILENNTALKAAMYLDNLGQSSAEVRRPQVVIEDIDEIAMGDIDEMGDLDEMGDIDDSA